LTLAPVYEVVFVHAGKSGIIPGWYRTNDVSDSFQVSEYAIPDVM
jgi:hypothetical protein